MSRFVVPSEPRLEQLIGEAYDLMPGPDMTRLAQIEGKLSRYLKTEKRISRLSKLPWWIVLLLVGGFASAAWWAGENWLHKRTAPVPLERQQGSRQKEFMQNKPEQNKAQELHSETDKADEEDQSAVIYQRESY